MDCDEPRSTFIFQNISTWIVSERSVWQRSWRWRGESCKLRLQQTIFILDELSQILLFCIEMFPEKDKKNYKNKSNLSNSFTRYKSSW